MQLQLAGNYWKLDGDDVDEQIPGDVCELVVDW